MIDESTILDRAKFHAPVDIESTIQALGINLVRENLETGQSGYFSKEDTKFTIGVNSRDSFQRQRFTMAHELGHFVLHRDMLKDGEHFDRLYDDARYNNSPWPFTPQHETQANKFAAEFIMPTSLTKRHWLECRNPTEVAKKFGVSLGAAQIRLKNLGLLRE